MPRYKCLNYTGCWGERERGQGGGGGGQKNRQQVRSQLQRSDKPVFASSQVLGRGGLNHSFGFWAPICPNCPKPIFVHQFVKKTAPNLFLDTYLSKTYFEAPIYPTLPKTYFETPICPKIVLHLIVQNLFLAIYLPKTAQNLFKDFDGYVEMASDLLLPNVAREQ